MLVTIERGLRLTGSTIISLGNLDFYRPLGPMTIEAAENLAEDDLLPAAVACCHLAGQKLQNVWTRYQFGNLTTCTVAFI